jgi:hypothetical protein
VSAAQYRYKGKLKGHVSTDSRSRCGAMTCRNCGALLEDENEMCGTRKRALELFKVDARLRITPC